MSKWHVYNHYLRKLVIIFTESPKLRNGTEMKINTIAMVNCYEISLRGRGAKSWETERREHLQEATGTAERTLCLSFAADASSERHNHVTKAHFRLGFWTWSRIDLAQSRLCGPWKASRPCCSAGRAGRSDRNLGFCPTRSAQQELTRTRIPHNP